MCYFNQALSSFLGRVRSLIMRQGDKDELVNLAEFWVQGLNRKPTVTSHIIQKEMGITNPQTARDVLTVLYHRKILLRAGTGTVYYVNPNPPSALSPYSSRF